MAFIQIIEMRTSKIDELTRSKTSGERRPRESGHCVARVVGQDRNDPTRHLIVAFFDSYESAMENSNLPETTAFGEKQAALLDAPPVFWDLDVVNDNAS